MSKSGEWLISVHTRRNEADPSRPLIVGLSVRDRVDMVHGDFVYYSTEWTKQAGWESLKQAVRDCMHMAGRYHGEETKPASDSSVEPQGGTPPFLAEYPDDATGD